MYEYHRDEEILSTNTIRLIQQPTTWNLTVPAFGVTLCGNDGGGCFIYKWVNGKSQKTRKGWFYILSVRMTRQTMGLFTDSTNLFKKESALQESWTPDEIPEREEEYDKILEKFESIGRGIENGDEPNVKNIFVSGKTGQGKTATARIIMDEVKETVKSEGLNINTYRISLKDVNTSYQAVGKILVEIEEDTKYPPTGLSQTALNDRMFNKINEIGGYVVLFLDEIDNLGSDEGLLYQIPRAQANNRLSNANISMIGISNDLNFKSTLDASTKDTLFEKEVYFSPYDAKDLRSILKKRVNVAFEDGVVDNAAIAKTAALSAQDTGSARQAIRIIHEAGEIACSNADKTVTEEHIDDAMEEIEEINITNNLKDMTVNDQAVLLALVVLEQRNGTPARTKEVYSEYKRVTAASDVEKLTMRSVRDKLINLDTYNIVLVHEKSGGVQGGKHYVSELSVDAQSIVDGFENIDRFEVITNDIDEFSHQSTLS